MKSIAISIISIVAMALMPASRLSAQTSDADIKKARESSGNQVIRCSPDGSGDAMFPLQALATIKRGAELVLLPGHYEGHLEITADRVIIRGEGLGKCEVDLVIRGKDVVIRNLWFNDLRLPEGGVTVVDAIMRSVHAGSESRRKTQHGLYNCGFQYLVATFPETRLDVRRCTLVADEEMPEFLRGFLASMIPGTPSPVSSFDGAEINFDASVICSPGIIFSFVVYPRRQAPKLSLRNNLLFGNSGLGQIHSHGSDTGKTPKISFDLKTLRRQAKVSLQGENLVEKPKFMTPPDASSDDDDMPPHRRRHRFGGMRPEHFRLAPDSPGADRGLIPAEHPFLAQPAPPADQPAQPEPLPDAPVNPAPHQPRPRPDDDFPIQPPAPPPPPE